MAFRSRIVLAMASAAVLALASACGDDSTGPSSELWSDVTLPALGKAGFVDIAAHGSRVVAIGAAERELSGIAAVAVQTTGATWRELELPAMPLHAMYAGIDIDAAGKAVLVGGTPSQDPLVLDERVGWEAAALTRVGVLNAVAAGTNGTWIAAGTANGGLAAVSTSPGAWVADHAGFTTEQEKGLVDISEAGGVFAACGWDDDAGIPVLRIHDSNGWKDLAGPGFVHLPEAHDEYRSVLIEAGGALWLGGTTIDTSGISEVYTARLARRPANGDWVEVVLPDAAGAEVVNDILQASDGSLYLACGEKKARVLRWDGSIWHDEGPGTSGQMLALAEDGSGRIYAAGAQHGGLTDPLPLLRVRQP